MIDFLGGMLELIFGLVEMVLGLVFGAVEFVFGLLGGIASLLFSLAGFVLIAALIGLFISRRRKAQARAQDNSVLVLGDASYITCSYLVKAFGDYLKSDMVQLAHHGYAGGTIALYEKVDADVLLWPGGVGGFDGGLEPQDLKNRETNAVAISLAKEVYVAGESVFTFVMPYTPKDTDKPIIIK